MEISLTKKGESVKVQSSLVRLLLPSFDDAAKSTDRIDLPSLDNGSHIQSIDNLKYYIRRSKKDCSKKSAPFRLLSAISQKPSQSTKAVSVLLMVARPTLMTFYFEDLSESSFKTNKQQVSSVSFPMPDSKLLSAVSLSPNGKDVACGCNSGEILIMTNLLAMIEDYAVGMEKYRAQTDSNDSAAIDKPTHPSKTVIPRKLHWHAHPVATLSYVRASSAAEPMLYSGGEESVLVSWQLSRGTYKASDLLPRIALGGLSTFCARSSPGSRMAYWCIAPTIHCRSLNHTITHPCGSSRVWLQGRRKRLSRRIQWYEPIQGIRMC